MALWLRWWSIIRLLRPAFSREVTFLWFVTAVAATTIRSDLAGVTSLVRALKLSPRVYGLLLDSFHSSAVKIQKLNALWAAVVIKMFPGIVRIKGRIVLVGDGIKIAKEGKKMPAVKSLHQESGSNSKAPYIMGHSCQVIGVLTKVAGYVFAVPLISRIHEGVVSSNRDSRTLIDKMIAMLDSLTIPTPVYLVLDAYYGNRKMIVGLVSLGNNLISRVKRNAVAYYPAPTPDQPKRGRPKLYGKKIKFKSLFDTCDFKSAPSPVYGEDGVEIQYHTIDLLWKPFGKLVRFVLVKHPSRGKIVFLATDLLLSAIDIIELYGLRFKIEVSFKQSVHTIGTYAYHFWMKSMDPIKRFSGDQYIHRKSEEYRLAVYRKMQAFHVHIQVGVIAQGVMQYLSMMAKKEIWESFGSWLRTIRPEVLPSEQVVASSMRNSIREFLGGTHEAENLVKFIRKKQAFAECEQELGKTGS